MVVSSIDKVLEKLGSIYRDVIDLEELVMELRQENKAMQGNLRTAQHKVIELVKEADNADRLTVDTSGRNAREKVGAS